MILRRGLRIKNIKARITAPIRRVWNPPSIVNPGTICGMKYRANKYIAIDLRIVFMCSIIVPYQVKGLFLVFQCQRTIVIMDFHA